MHRIGLAIAAITLLAVFGCSPQVGDKCLNSIECQGLACDTTVEGGYCIRYGCDDGVSCPDESVCVEFDNVAACMRRCTGRDDERCPRDLVCRHDRDVPFCFVAADDPEPLPESVPFPDASTLDVSVDNDIDDDAESDVSTDSTSDPSTGDAADTEGSGDSAE